MTGFEFAVTYAVCWWLVLFMVLPHQADAAAAPEVGHAPSAPAKPQLRKKIRWATLLAFLPAIALYFIVDQAKAATPEEEGIYRTSSKCKPLSVHTPRADVAARDGYATGGKTVAPATLGGENKYVPETFEIPLRLPADAYMARPGQQEDLSDSFISAGRVSVGRDGTTSINGAPVAPQETYAGDCPTE